LESNPGRLSLPSVGWCTGQSGADCFPNLAQPTVEDLEPLAHRTVWCPHQTVGPATRHAWSTVGSADHWLTGQSGAPPDSPVIFSRTPPPRPESRQFTRRQPGAPDTVRCTTRHCPVHHRTLSGAPPDTVRCTTRQSGAPRLSRVLAARAKSFPFVFSLILALRQIC
jgi:hypothetical protein